MWRIRTKTGYRGYAVLTAYIRTNWKHKPYHRASPQSGGECPRKNIVCAGKLALLRHHIGGSRTKGCYITNANKLAAPSPR